MPACSKSQKRHTKNNTAKLQITILSKILLLLSVKSTSCSDFHTFATNALNLFPRDFAVSSPLLPIVLIFFQWRPTMVCCFKYPFIPSGMTLLRLAAIQYVAANVPSHTIQSKKSGYPLFRLNNAPLCSPRLQSAQKLQSQSPPTEHGRFFHFLSEKS